TLPDGCTPMPVIPECMRYDSTLPRDPQHCALKPQDGKVCVGMALDRAQVADSGAMALQSRAVRLYSDSAELFLRAFRAPQTVVAGQNFSVETDWRTQQPLHGDYHLFIHVLDSSGQAVAQYDGVPGAGSFPTTAWAATQDWQEQAAIAIPTSVTPGQYSIYVGWYHYPDLTRLKVDSATPHASDGLVYLQDVNVQAP
ncbi:MAG TPA: hypothetical protein VKQ72_07840, partial [Aggregatilineales bacterium]|nr:hypothetical protein [Aggregatilineales bacterium]